MWTISTSILSSIVDAFAKHVRHSTLMHDAPRKCSDKVGIGTTRVPKIQNTIYRQVLDTRCWICLTTWSYPFSSCVLCLGNHLKGYRSPFVHKGHIYIWSKGWCSQKLYGFGHQNKITRKSLGTLIRNRRRPNSRHFLIFRKFLKVLSNLLRQLSWQANLCGNFPQRWLQRSILHRLLRPWCLERKSTVCTLVFEKKHAV